MPFSHYGTGRIGEIIDYLLSKHNTDDITDIDTKDKLDALCENLGLAYSDFDDLILDNSPVLRTVKGHVFETFFDTVVQNNGHESIEVGGDRPIDREVNGITLQLKTPTLAGTKDNDVQYKTHKTHGAKSEKESMDYYHKKEEFADYLVGLISYEPLRIIFIAKNDLPTALGSSEHIMSPFTVNWSEHPGLNDFSSIGINAADISSVVSRDENELLPRLCTALNVSTEVIVNTILNKENFRIWDMAIRGFGREMAFNKFCIKEGIELRNPLETGRARADKADHVVMNTKLNKLEFLQMKGVSTNNCEFTEGAPKVAVETQLTRGRVNDHPTQSRLYLAEDFDYLIIGLDPALAYGYACLSGLSKPQLKWQFFAVPTSALERHKKFNNRLHSLQRFDYKTLLKYHLDKSAMSMWL